MEASDLKPGMKFVITSTGRECSLVEGYGVGAPTMWRVRYSTGDRWSPRETIINPLTEATPVGRTSPPPRADYGYDV